MLSAGEKRVFARVPVVLPGKLFFGGIVSRDCRIMNLSCAGAGVQCDVAVPGAAGVLYIEHLGRVAVTGRQRRDAVLGFEFDCTQRKRWEMGLAIVQYLTSGVTQLTRLRRRERLAVSRICVTRPDGETFHCDAMDISSCGMLLGTDRRPPIGERIDVEGMTGRVVRHQSGGVAVELLENGPGAVVPFPKGLGPRNDGPQGGAG